jgi:hypothetical protein
VISLFSNSPKKDLTRELDEEASRARVQAAIERALYIPEVEVSVAPQVQEISSLDVACESANCATMNSEAAVDPWDVVKDFLVREELNENAA